MMFLVCLLCSCVLISVCKCECNFSIDKKQLKNVKSVTISEKLENNCMKCKTLECSVLIVGAKSSRSPRQNILSLLKEVTSLTRKFNFTLDRDVFVGVLSHLAPAVGLSFLAGSYFGGKYPGFTSYFPSISSWFSPFSTLGSSWTGGGFTNYGFPNNLAGFPSSFHSFSDWNSGFSRKDNNKINYNFKHNYKPNFWPSSYNTPTFSESGHSTLDSVSSPPFELVNKLNVHSKGLLNNFNSLTGEMPSFSYANTNSEGLMNDFNSPGGKQFYSFNSLTKEMPNFRHTNTNSERFVNDFNSPEGEQFYSFNNYNSLTGEVPNFSHANTNSEGLVNDFSPEREQFYSFNNFNSFKNADDQFSDQYNTFEAKGPHSFEKYYNFEHPDLEQYLFNSLDNSDTFNSKYLSDSFNEKDLDVFNSKDMSSKPLRRHSKNRNKNKNTFRRRFSPKHRWAFTGDDVFL